MNSVFMFKQTKNFLKYFYFMKCLIFIEKKNISLDPVKILTYRTLQNKEDPDILLQKFRSDESGSWYLPVGAIDPYCEATLGYQEQKTPVNSGIVIKDGFGSSLIELKSYFCDIKPIILLFETRPYWNTSMLFLILL